jgi:NAD(P)-dependent dehydrogenase (short-subunit alcohol dehydrogenase family)
VPPTNESLRYELAPLGIQVTVIEPGAFRTNFLDETSLVTAEARIEDYAGTAGATRHWAEQANHAQPGDPVKAAKVIVDLAARGSLPERIQLGEDCFAAVAGKLARSPFALPGSGRYARPSAPGCEQGLPNTP